MIGNQGNAMGINIQQTKVLPILHIQFRKQKI